MQIFEGMVYDVLEMKELQEDALQIYKSKEEGE